MIFGNDGNDFMNSFGNTNFFGNGSVQNRMGNTTYEGGNISVNMGNTSYNTNGIVNKMGNTYYSSEGVYSVMGNTMYGPGGKVWTGIQSDDDARAIIFHNQNK